MSAAATRITKKALVTALKGQDFNTVLTHMSAGGCNIEGRQGCAISAVERMYRKFLGIEITVGTHMMAVGQRGKPREMPQWFRFLMRDLTWTNANAICVGDVLYSLID